MGGLLAVAAVAALRRGLGEALGPYGWVPMISALVSLAATPIARALARRWGVIDRPDGYLKPHARPIAYLGGVAVYLGWLAGMSFLVIQTRSGAEWVFGLALAGGIAMLVGLADDLLDLRPMLKIAGQVLAALALLYFGIGRDWLHAAVGPMQAIWPWLSVPTWLSMSLSCLTTVFLVVAACNAANLLDGLDGLCSGVTGIISLMFVVLATHLAMNHYDDVHDPVRIVAALAMAGAVFGFLPYNFSPATIFLGDAGSMLLGLFAAAVILMFGEHGILRWVLGAAMIFALPILDTTLALIRRIRLHHRIFGGDRSHLYDQLVDRGFTVKQTVAIMYALSLFYGLMGLAIILIRTRYAIPVYVLVGAVTLYLCHRWGFLKPPAETPHERAANEER